MKNGNVIVKQDCHSRVFLSGIFRVLSRYAHKGNTLFINNSYVEDPRLQTSGMTALYNNGFTLIELLVVVLIIGILAAVAVPQYQLAVEKARATEALVNLKNLSNAFELYYVANGKYPSNLNELDIDLPTMGHGYHYAKNSIYIGISNIKSGTNKEYEIAAILPHGEWQNSNYLFFNRVCSIAKDEDNSLAAKVCKSLCNKTSLAVVWGSGEKGCRWKE